MAKRRLLQICILLLVCVAGALCYPAIQERRETARRLHQAKDILTASKLYAFEHAGHLPTTFADLSTLTSTSDGHRYYQPLESSGSFLNRAAQELEILSPGILDSADPGTVYLRELKTDRRGRRVVGYADASAMLVREH